jgi:hypothetical protein
LNNEDLRFNKTKTSDLVEPQNVCRIQKIKGSRGVAKINFKEILNV